jgi:hypothetical protein
VVGAPTLDLPDVLSPIFCSDEQQEAIKKLGATSCSTGCHASRGKGFYDPDAYLHMIKKYLAAGLMPPVTPLSSDSIVAGSTKASREHILDYGEKARQCFVDAAMEEVRLWLKDTKCNTQ